MKFLKVLLIIVLLTGIIELALRLIWGFGTPVLYSSSKEFEYIYKPNQDVKRYGNHILTNSYGMRSPEPAADDSIRILYLGDSVINGGMLTSQDNLSSTLLSESLSKMSGMKVNVLNISSGSWGPDNAAAFVKKYGTFNASAMVLVFSSHDAFDNMDFEPVVDRNIHYPGHNPQSAISEVFLRYFMPLCGNIFGVSEYSSEKLMINKQRTVFNSGWNELRDIAAKHSIPLIVVLHAEQAELSNGKYNRYGLRILDTLQTNHVNYITDLSAGIKEEYYRDFIHLNDTGQKFLADIITPALIPFINRDASKMHSAGSM